VGTLSEHNLTGSLGIYVPPFGRVQHGRHALALTRERKFDFVLDVFEPVLAKITVVGTHVFDPLERASSVLLPVAAASPLSLYRAVAESQLNMMPLNNLPFTSEGRDDASLGDVPDAP